MKISKRRKILGIIFSAVVLISMLSVLTPALGKNKTISTVNTGYGYGYGCDPCTPGFWKNHPEAWPVSSITIGGVTYSMASAIAFMQEPTAGDKTHNMFEHLVAAKLNILNGCVPNGIDDVIDDADDWMIDHPLDSDVKANSPAWDEGEPIFNLLVSYNES